MKRRLNIFLAVHYLRGAKSLLWSSLSGPNILLSTLLSNTLSLHSSLNVSYQVSHPYTTTGKITFLYVLILICSDCKRKTKDSAPNNIKNSLTSGFLYIILICYGCSKLCELFHPFKGTIINLHTVNSSCILFSRHDSVLGLVNIFVLLVQSPY